MSGSYREALSDVHEAVLDVREWLEGSYGCAGHVWRPPRMSGSGQEALPDVQE